MAIGCLFMEFYRVNYGPDILGQKLLPNDLADILRGNVFEFADEEAVLLEVDVRDVGVDLQRGGGGLVEKLQILLFVKV